jgi:hypothetical protein
MRTGPKAGRIVLAAFALGALALLLAIGLRSGLRDGRAAAGGGETAAFDPAWSPVERAVAAQALATWRLEARGVGGPLRLLVLDERVTVLARRPGTCATPVPDAFPDAAAYDHHAVVRAYTAFGIEVASARFTCGGLAWETG